MKKVSRASMTIELACLMPLYLLVIITSIYLCFYMHNVVCLTAIAREAAQVGVAAGQNGEDEENAAEIRIRQRTSLPAYGRKDLRYKVEEKGKSLSVTLEADTIAVYGGAGWHIKVEASEKKTDPVSFIRACQGLS